MKKKKVTKPISNDERITYEEEIRALRNCIERLEQTVTFEDDDGLDNCGYWREANSYNDLRRNGRSK